MKITGEVEAKNKAGTSIKVGEDWFGSFKGKGLASVQKGQTVSFEYTENGKWKNIVDGTLKVTSAPSGSGAQSQSWKNPNQLGIELGHASNLAMQVANRFGTDLDEQAFLDYWEGLTKEVYLRMKSLRDEAEKGFSGAVEPEAEEPSPFD